MTPATVKACAGCGTELVRRRKESHHTWTMRTHCTPQCRSDHRLATIEELVEAGLDGAEIAAKLNVQAESLASWLYKRGRPDLGGLFFRRVKGPVLMGSAKPDIDMTPLLEVTGVRGNCYGLPVDLFFPDTDGDPHDARRVCRGCPLQVPCLEVAVRNREAGIWGGATAAERAEMRRNRRRTAA